MKILVFLCFLCPDMAKDILRWKKKIQIAHVCGKNNNNKQHFWQFNNIRLYKGFWKRQKVSSSSKVLQTI